MTISSLNSGLPIAGGDLARAPAPAGGAAEGGFGNTLREAVAEVDNLNLDAGRAVSNLVAGNGADVHQAMIAVEKADLSFQLMLQVRNKVVQAYQQIAGMQF